MTTRLALGKATELTAVHSPHLTLWSNFTVITLYVVTFYPETGLIYADWSLQYFCSLSGFKVGFWRACQLSCSCVAKYLGSTSVSEVTVDRCVILRCFYDTSQLPLPTAQEKEPIELRHRTKSTHFVNLNTGWTNETRG